MSNQIINQDSSDDNENKPTSTEVENIATGNKTTKKKKDKALKEKIDVKKESDKANTALVPNQVKGMESTGTETNKKVKKISLLTIGIISLLVFILAVSVIIFSIINNNDVKMKKGVSIEGVDVSELTKEEARKKVQTEFLDNLDDTIYFQYGENLYSIALEEINVKYNLDDAVEKAYEIGRTGSTLAKDIATLKLKKEPINITIDVNYDEIALDACIINISAKLPEQVEQPSYYIEDGKLIITSGKVGKAALNDETQEIVRNALNSKNFKDVYYDIPTYDKYPDEIDVDKIHSEIYREVKDAYYTIEPRMVYPEEVGVDFAESVETVKEQIALEKKYEYEVPLKYTPANITVNDIGAEAFPDQLATYSTAYVNNANRTTNLRLAAQKINGTVIMPGETFSYNKTVGERTIAAGYKNAAIYENGRVVDGLGGGICQVSSTLYNSVLYSNLEVVERHNHMFLTTYTTGGRDATVAYGSLDFKFKNNRNYPIKIAASVQNGYCTVSIYGLKTEDDYQVEIATSKTGARTYQTYKKLFKNGSLVDTVWVSTDSYGVHN